MAIGAFTIGIVRFFSLVVGSLFILVLPGWLISFIEFPYSDRLSGTEGLLSRRALDWIERLTLAVTLSIIISSAIVFALFNFPEGSKLTPKNFSVATILLNVMFFAMAAWRAKWIPFAFTFVLGAFPLIVIVVNQVFAVAITARNFLIEVSFLLLVLIIIQGITKYRFTLLKKLGQRP